MQKTDVLVLEQTIARSAQKLGRIEPDVASELERVAGGIQ